MNIEQARAIIGAQVLNEIFGPDLAMRCEADDICFAGGGNTVISAEADLASAILCRYILMKNVRSKFDRILAEQYASGKNLLTPLQREVMEMRISGKSFREIALELDYSFGHVKLQARQAKARLGI